MKRCHTYHMQLRRRHRAQLVVMSEDGTSKKDAAARIGLTMGGVNNLSREEFGTQRWPIAEHEPMTQKETGDDNRSHEQ